jgi:hypothetical protein
MYINHVAVSGQQHNQLAASIPNTPIGGAAGMNHVFATGLSLGSITPRSLGGMVRRLALKIHPAR